MIPSTITRTHVEQAIAEIDRDRVPQHRASVKYRLVYRDKRYPPKYVLSLAGRYAEGAELTPQSFDPPEANDFLRKLDFEIEECKVAELRAELSKRHYVQKSEKMWFNFHESKLKQYRELGDNFCLVIFGDEVTEDNFYSIPFPHVRHLFAPENMAKRGKRWMGTIHEYTMTLGPAKGIPVNDFHGVLPDEVPDYYFEKAIWGIYVANSAVENFKISRAAGIWGCKDERFALGVREGDELLFVNSISSNRSPVPSGYPRVTTPEEFQGLASTVVKARVTSPPYPDDSPLWHDAQYPWRFKFQETGTFSNCPVIVPDYSLEELNAVRLSAVSSGRPVLVQKTPSLTQEPPPAPAPEEHLVVEHDTAQQAQDHLKPAVGGARMELPTDYLEPSFNEIVTRVRTEGLKISDKLLRRYHVSLKTRGFVILSGISGTGKTWLACCYGDAVGAEYLLVPVAPNWNTNEDLLGYYNPMESSYFHTPFSRFLQKASKAYDAATVAGVRPRPFHVVLDEMNLARIEYYFAKFLSVMEVRSRGGKAELELAPGEMVTLPPNLFVIGTVNIDETTHGFADKVYDRAQLIELDAPRDLLAEHMGAALYRGVLLEIWDALQGVAPFAFRVVDEIDQYVKDAQAVGAGWEEALDEQLLQKLLPKLKGTDPRVATALQQFEKITVGRFPLSHAKAARMTETFASHGFASYF